MLEDPTPAERAVLGAFPYQENEAMLHTDERAAAAHAAGARRLELSTCSNARQCRRRVALTYDMNMLQTLDAPVHFLVTLNRGADIDPERSHPHA